MMTAEVGAAMAENQKSAGALSKAGVQAKWVDLTRAGVDQ